MSPIVQIALWVLKAPDGNVKECAIEKGAV